MSDQRAQVAAFLHQFKQIVSSGRGLDIIPRVETNATIVDLGLTRRNVEDEIVGLSVDDYCAGPEPDRDRSGEVWIFGKEIASQAIYIKLKIFHVGDTVGAKCISFHGAKHPMSYPLRGRRDSEGEEMSP